MSINGPASKPVSTRFSPACRPSTDIVDALAASALAIAACEGGVAALVHWLKGGCPWIITPADLRPLIDRDGLERFVAHGWDKELGWVRKPGSAHDEIGKDGRTTRYHIAADGTRLDPGFEGQAPLTLLHGDSYAFSRQVGDHETWAHQLSLRLGGRVANYGVGNYGLDQALLRLRREFDARPADLVLMCVVPETICRVTSVWRHFSEYGNTFALKPRFTLCADGTLALRPNPADAPERILRIADMLPKLMAEDYFYPRKFAPDMLRFPYLWHIWRSRRRNLPLIAGALADRFGGDGRNAFCRVMERNIALTAELYREQEPLDLLVAITEDFDRFVREKGSTPVLVLLPQLYDLKRLRAGDHYYRPYLERIEDTLPVVDFGPCFAALDDDATNYIDDRFGGHLSAAANVLVAAHLADVCRPLLSGGQAGQS